MISSEITTSSSSSTEGSSDSSGSASSENSDYHYSIAFYYDDDGETLLAEVPLAQGEEPHYIGVLPEKPDDEEHQLQFQFQEWEFMAETSLTISYKATYIKCTIGLDFEGNEVSYYHGIARDVFVPGHWNGAQITKVQDGAFSGNSIIETVFISDGIQEIGERNKYNGVFENCCRLRQIRLPEGLSYLGYGCFARCVSLEEIDLPSTLISIGDCLFRFCNSLKTVLLPDSLTELSGYTFDGCTSLETVSLPNSLERMNGANFLDCSNLTHIELPRSLSYIGGDVFERTGLSSIYIPRSVDVISGCLISSTQNECLIYCEIDYKPKKWSSAWNHMDYPVTWGCSWEDYLDATQK